MTLKTRHFQFLLVLFNCFLSLLAQTSDYKSLDTADPIHFGGSYIIYQQDTIPLHAKSFFIDGNLSPETAKKWPYVFNSIQDAKAQLTNGTEANPMVLHIAPYVYWIDNPDDPEIRTPKHGSIPFGMEIQCDWLSFHGLTKNPENVVLACNRGQTIGAKGNFTMFKFDGQGTASENITFGNYCNVDLVFPLKPELNRNKRASAIVQAQLIICNGDKISAKNTRFISRLNLCPFVGGKRVFFNACYFESTDDALCGTGVYKDCKFKFFSSKPFYHTTGTGAIFLNCHIESLTHGAQYFTKAYGQLALINTTLTGNHLDYLGWNDAPLSTTKNYQYNVKVNNKPYLTDNKTPQNTVDLTHSNLLSAYVFNYNNKTIYNTYNLLKGDDDWDPENIKPIVLKAEHTLKRKLSNMPTQLRLHYNKDTLETGKDSLILSPSWHLFGNSAAKPEAISWLLNTKDKSLVSLRKKANGDCLVIPTNTTNFNKEIIITAKTGSGLEAACVLTIIPERLTPPEFSTEPEIKLTTTGLLYATYSFKNFKYTDQSEITWYKCPDASCNTKIKTAVSRFDTPLQTYTLSHADIGYYHMAVIKPKHQRSFTGQEKSVMFSRPIQLNDITADTNSLEFDFKNTPVTNQFNHLPGLWSFTPLQSDREDFTDLTKDAWQYAKGSQGSENQFGLLQTGRAAAMHYTPVNPQIKNIALTLSVSPFKSAGQGFSVSPLYMDVVINFDPITKSGYGLRLIRTTKYANAIDCYFVKYDKNRVEQISEAISTSCFRTPCLIRVELKDNELSARLKTEANYLKTDYPKEVLPEVYIKTQVGPLPFNSFGIEYHGGSSTMINVFKAEAKNINIP